MTFLHLRVWFVLLSLTGCATTPQDRSRIEALNRDLLTHPSATATLTDWCAHGRLADPPVIRAIQVPADDHPADSDVRALLGAGAGEVVKHRHVRLVCGSHLMSEADNWYLPARLTAAMNATLQTADTPFGRVVAPLNFRRRTLSVQVLGHPSRYAIVHRAVLITPDGTPFSLVVERYPPP